MFHLSIRRPCHVMDFRSIIAMYMDIYFVEIPSDTVSQFHVFFPTCYIIKQRLVNLNIFKCYCCKSNACFNIKPTEKVVILYFKSSNYLKRKNNAC